MKIRNAVIASALVLAPIASVAATQSAQAATVTCSTTHTDKTSTTSTGSWSHTITNKRTCGHSYVSHAYRLFESYTGAHSQTWTAKTGTTTPSHYQEHLVRFSWSKTGKLTVTVENITK